MTKSIKYAFYVGVVALALVGLSIFSGIALAEDPPDTQGQEQEAPDHKENIGPDVVRQTSDDTPNPDNAILAAETGLSIEEIDGAIALQKEFGEYAQGLLDQYPGQISAIWMDKPDGVLGPNTSGNVRFVGAVPTGIGTKDNVALTGAGLISLADHKLRAEVAAETLTMLGHNKFATFFDPKANVIQVELLLPEGTTEPSKAALIPAVRQQMGMKSELQGRAALLEVSDLELTVLQVSGPFITFLHSRGGNWLRDNGDRECTSGWSVDGPKGPGIITAGHCTGLDQFEQPGVTPYSMRFRSQVINYLGDVEYHTTSHAELAEFYATSSHIRDVDGIKATDLMVGWSVCFYGRKSNSRTCNIEVEAVNVTIPGPNGGSNVGSLARTDDTPAVRGDSGGGWSYGYVAWGVNSAYDNYGRGYFTPVEEAQDALNVTIRTQ